jgi:dTDP-glucose pyrophosphorylase
LNIIFSMAGLYSRFKISGYKKPKYLLKNIKGKTILEMVVDNILSSFDFANILFIANSRDIAFKSEINKCIHNYKNTSVIFVDDTDGQAHTVKIGIDVLKSEFKHFTKKLVVHNIDTILLGRDFIKINELLDNFDGVIDIIISEYEGYSYVSLNSQGLINEIAEKKVISNFATTGMYCFSNYNQYLECFSKIHSTNKELFVSDIYKEYLKRNLKLYKLEVKNAFTYEVGTPEQYEELLKDEIFNNL